MNKPSGQIDAAVDAARGRNSQVTGSRVTGLPVADAPRSGAPRAGTRPGRPAPAMRLDRDRWRPCVLMLTLVLCGNSFAHGQVNATDSPDDVRTWLAKVTDENPEVRRRAAFELGQLGPAAADQSVPALSRAIRDRSPTVAWYALDSLCRLGSVAAPAVEALVQAINDPVNKGYPHIRLNAVRALGTIGPSSRRAGKLLIGLTQPDNDGELRVAAAWALWQITEAQQILPLLSREIKAGGEPAYQACIHLSKIGPLAASETQPLVLALRSDDADLRRAAAKALGSFGVETIPVLAKALNPTLRFDRPAVLSAIGFIVDRLRTDLFYDPRSSSDAVRPAVQSLAKDAVPPLIALVRGGDQPVASQASRTLARLGIIAVPALLKTALAETSEAGRTALLDCLVLSEKYLPASGQSTADDISQVKIASAAYLIQGIKSDVPRVRGVSLRLYATLEIATVDKEAVSLLRNALRDEDSRNRHYAKTALERSGA